MTLGFILIISNLIGESPLILLSGIGALSAVLMLVFKDSLLGLVAGIQLTANDMVRVGDWIEMPKYGADGDVIDISLNTVMVQNFDKTITMIPKLCPYFRFFYKLERDAKLRRPTNQALFVYRYQ